MTPILYRFPDRQPEVGVDADSTDRKLSQSFQRLALFTLVSVAPILSPVSDQVRAQVPDELTGTLLVVNKEASTVTLFDLGRQEARATLPTGQGPHEVIASSDGRTAVVTDYGSGNSLTVVDVASARVVRTIDLSTYPSPHGIQYLPGDSLVAVTSEASANVVIVDVGRGAVVKAIPTGQRGSHMLAVVADGSTIYTGNTGDGTVARLDVALGERTGLFPVPPRPEAIQVDRQGSRVWVGSNSEGLVSVLDPERGTVQSPLEGFGWPYRILPVPSRSLLVLPDLDRSEVRFVTVPDYEELDRLNFPDAGTQGVTTTPDERWLFVSLSRQDQVAIVDLETRAVVGTIPTGDGPDGLAWSEVTPED